MLDPKTLLLTLSGLDQPIPLWELTEDLMLDNNLTEPDIDNIHTNLMLYYQRADVMGDRRTIAILRENLVDLIWSFAYDEFEDNESFLSLAKCTEPDLIQSVHGCLTYCLDRMMEYDD